MKVVYIAFGTAQNYKQAAYSILTFIRYHGLNYSIHLFTDSPKAFKGLDKFIEIHQIPDKNLQKWMHELRWIDRKGVNTSYPWIVKPYILRDLDDSILYLDSDTYVVKPLDDMISKIDKCNSLMCIFEYELVMQKRLDKIIKNGLGGLISGNTVMWNSSILGVHKENLDIFSEAIGLTKKILEVEPTLHTAEQLAISILLDMRTKILSSSDHIVHYWKSKGNFYTPDRDSTFSL